MKRKMNYEEKVLKHFNQIKIFKAKKKKKMEKKQTDNQVKKKRLFFQ